MPISINPFTFLFLNYSLFSQYFFLSGSYPTSQMICFCPWLHVQSYPGLSLSTQSEWPPTQPRTLPTGKIFLTDIYQSHSSLGCRVASVHFQLILTHKAEPTVNQTQPPSSSTIASKGTHQIAMGLSWRRSISTTGEDGIQSSRPSTRAANSCLLALLMPRLGWATSTTL